MNRKLFMALFLAACGAAPERVACPAGADKPDRPASAQVAVCYGNAKGGAQSGGGGGETPETPSEPTGGGNNGWGNGDQDAPGNSGPNNRAENNVGH